MPRDSGFNDKEKLESAINEMRTLGVKVIIGPVSFEEFEHIKNLMIYIYFTVKY